MGRFYIFTPTLTRSVTTIAIVLLFISLFVAIVGPISLWHWWGAGAVPTYTLTAGKSTRFITVLERFTGSECPPELDCLMTTAVQTFNGTLHASYDTSLRVGTSWAKCVAMGDYADSGAGIWQRCKTVYEFNGEGNITAGTLIAVGETFVSEEYLSQTKYLVTGGTGAYTAASGGALTSTLNLEGNRDLTFVDVLVS
jgi:hypothetical protein